MCCCLICSTFCGSGFFAAATVGLTDVAGLVCETEGAALADTVAAGVALAVAAAGVVLAVAVAGVVGAVAASLCRGVFSFPTATQRRGYKLSCFVFFRGERAMLGIRQTHVNTLFAYFFSPGFRTRKTTGLQRFA